MVFDFLGAFGVEDFEGFAGGVLFGFLLAFASPDGEDAFSDMAADFENLAVIGAGGADDGVMGGDAADFLGGVLQFGFGIGIAAGLGADAHLGAEDAEDEGARGFESAVEIDGGGDGFEKIGVDAGGKRFVAGEAFAEAADIAEADEFGGAGETGGADDTGFDLGQVAFVPIRMPFVEGLSDAEIDDGITEEFHAFVVAVGVRSAGGMRERTFEEAGVIEEVTDALLQTQEAGVRNGFFGTEKNRGGHRSFWENRLKEADDAARLVERILFKGNLSPAPTDR